VTVNVLGAVGMDVTAAGAAAVSCSAVQDGTEALKINELRHVGD